MVLRALVGCLLLLALAVFAFAQSETTGGLSGQVRDPSGGAIRGATVTIIYVDTGFRRVSQTDAEGRFTFPQVQPGTYRVEADAAAFEPAQQSVAVPLGRVETVTLTLAIAGLTASVSVSSEPPLLNTRNPNTTTIFTAKRIEALPNPGGDITFPAQLAAGALMNTAGSGNDFVGGPSGFGNYQVNGMPGTSNGFIVDGLETNDPLTNLNSGLSTNLVLGLNSMEEVTVNTTSYRVDQGRYAASQVNYVTKSGTNAFHGDAYGLYNGSALNAANYFTDLAGGQKPDTRVLHYGGSLGGPVHHDKLFFFVDAEQVRIQLPIATTVNVPSPAFQQYVLTQLPRGGVDVISGTTYPAAPQLVPFYQRMFSLYRNASGLPVAALGCPLMANGTAPPGAVPDGDGCANRQNVTLSSPDHEQVFTLRLDHNINANNFVWYRFQSDTGLQAAYTDPINPLFNSLSPQPLYSFVSGYTHVFSDHLVNHFNPSFSWYSSIFQPADLNATVSAFPIVLQAEGPNVPFTTLGGLDNLWPQGRRATRFQVNDDVTWTNGRHEWRFGESVRWLRFDNYDFGAGTTPLVTYTTLPQFIYGVASTATRAFPAASVTTFSVSNIDAFTQDTVKVSDRVTWTLGLRAAWITNPSAGSSALTRLNGSFDEITHDVNQPITAVMATGQRGILNARPGAVWQPRTSVAWQVQPQTLLRAGFGVFGDLVPAGSLIDAVAPNPPFVNTFQGGLLGSAGGLAIAPGVPNSAVDATSAANQAFLAGFHTGELSCASTHANPAACLPAVNVTALPPGGLAVPYYLQWSAGVERELPSRMMLRAQYVGTRGYDLTYQMHVNGYQTVCNGCFAPYPYMISPDPRFGDVTQFMSDATSQYNGLQLTLERRPSAGLSWIVNYTLSHAQDDVSNGGFLPFSTGAVLSPLPGELARNWGDADYDVRHNVSATYTYELPLHTSRAWLASLVDGWQISETFFWRTGLPFTVQSAPYTANGKGIINGGGPQFASLVPGVPLYTTMSIPGVTPPSALQWLNPDAFVSSVDPSTGACRGGDSPATCQFGTLGRNTVRGPQFFWSDLYVSKRIGASGTSTWRAELQVFNLFNRANFGLPTSIAGISGNASTQTGFGALTYTTSPPTGLLGVGLGGDNSPRMIAVQIRCQF
ncbi:MAG TPA: carboxypeptidase-like regulatory domain-containing protein [Vicinamibacterales bacterium]|nr:carboxypeptidase-like regulatory domain-containing protein [Vicinamibacterales bacterium]